MSWLLISFYIIPQEGWLDKAAIFFNEAIFSCSESTSRETLHNLVEEHERECARRYESVHENLKMLLAATMVLSLIGTVLNGVMMVTVSRDQVSDSHDHPDNDNGEYLLRAWTWLKILHISERLPYPRTFYLHFHSMKRVCTTAGSS